MGGWLAPGFQLLVVGQALTATVPTLELDGMVSFSDTTSEAGVPGGRVMRTAEKARVPLKPPGTEDPLLPP